MAETGRSRITKSTDIIVAFGIVGIIVMMVVPLPPSWLDMLIALNITGSVLILMLAVFTKKSFRILRSTVSATNHDPLPTLAKHIYNPSSSIRCLCGRYHSTVRGIRY